MKKTAVFLADGFEEIEALTPVDFLKRAGIEVTTYSISDSKSVMGSHDIEVKADRLLSEADLEDTDLLLLPGGKGTELLENCEKLAEILKEADSKGKYIAAICAAPRVIGKLGFLKGQKATCFPGNEKFLEGAEVDLSKKAVISGRYVTARGMGAAIEFSAAVTEVLLGKEKAEEILSKIQF